MTGQSPGADAPVLAGLAAAARARPHTAALFLPAGPAGRGAAGWRAMTYGQLWARARAIATGLRAIGLAPGDRAVLLVPPSADFFALVFGMLHAGIVPVLVDPGVGREHLKRCLDQADPVAFIGTAKAHAARLALRWAPRARHSVLAGSAGPIAALGSRRSTSPRGFSILRQIEQRGDDQPGTPLEGTAAILFTSGSTGPPKGVEYTHANFAAQIVALTGLYDLGPDDVQLATFPPFAIFGPVLGMTTIVPRMDPTRPADVDPENIIEPLDAFGATVMFGSPALLDTVSRWANPRGLRLTGLRLVMSAGAPVSRRIVAATSAMLEEGARLVTPYGATEALPVTSIDHREILHREPRPGSPSDQGETDGGSADLGVCVGTPAPGLRVGVMRITDEQVPHLDGGDFLAPGEIGEIVVSGGVVTSAYFARPAATAAAKTLWDGVLAHRMGDVGALDEHGRLWFCGRKAHLISTRDGVIAPVPIEVVFDAHPWVRRSAVIGIGTAGRQQPCLCVERAPDAPPPEVVRADLRRLAAAHDRTAVIADVRIHPGFPVDIRHNAKINYAALVGWWVRG